MFPVIRAFTCWRMAIVVQTSVPQQLMASLPEPGAQRFGAASERLDIMRRDV